jgi:hypothetical protein
MNLEEDLRATLHERATAPMPPAGDLMTNINIGVRRDVRRRRLAAVGAAVVAVVAALAVPVIVRGDGNASRPAPAASVPPAPAPSEKWPGWLTPSASFSTMVNWVPPNAGPNQIFQLGPNEMLKFSAGDQILTAEVGPLEPEWSEDAAEEHAADVGGQRATVRTTTDFVGAKPGYRFIGVRWRMSGSGLWAQVQSWGTRTESEILRFARGLSRAPGDHKQSSQAPFEFVGVPPVLSGIQYFGGAKVCLAPADQLHRTRGPEGLCVNLHTEPFQPKDATATLTVRGDRAELHMDTGSLTLEQTENRHLSITWDPEKPPISQADLLRFAAGINLR